MHGGKLPVHDPEQLLGLNSTMEEDFLYPPETDDTGEFMDEYYGENLYEADMSYGELYDDEFMYERIPFLELADK